MDPASAQPLTIKGRGACSNATARFDCLQKTAFDDGWDHRDQQPPQFRLFQVPAVV